MDSTVIIPVDHSVAIDVKEGDYFGINVKYAKKAGEVENLPELKTIDSDDDVVSFSLGDQSYSKRISGVQEATVAKYDTKGRLLADILNTADVAEEVDNYLATINFVRSINGSTGNVEIDLTPYDRKLEELDNDLEDEVTARTANDTALQNAINTNTENVDLLNTSVTSLSNSVDTIDGKVDTLETTASNHETRVSNLENNTSVLSNTVSGLSISVNNLSERVTTDEDAISTLSSAVTSNTEEIAEIQGSITDLVNETTVDNKIAEAMAGEQVQDTALSNRITTLEAGLDTEKTDRQNADTQLRADYTAAISTAIGTIQAALANYYAKTEVDQMINNLQEAIEAINLSNYYTKTESDTKYVTLTDFNAAIANLQQQITDNIGRVLTSDPGVNNKVWVEQA